MSASEWQRYGTADSEQSLGLETIGGPRSEGWVPEMRADVRADGCVHLRLYSNGADPERDADVSENEEYIHICSLDEHIATLVALREKARAHFGSGWR